MVPSRMNRSWISHQITKLQITFKKIFGHHGVIMCFDLMKNPIRLLYPRPQPLKQVTFSCHTQCLTARGQLTTINCYNLTRIINCGSGSKLRYASFWSMAKNHTPMVLLLQHPGNNPCDWLLREGSIDLFFFGDVYIYIIYNIKYIYIYVGVSLNGGIPKTHPKMIIFSRKTYGCWVPPF